MAKDYTVAYVARIPNCDLHMIVKGEEVPALYDARTSNGQWASLCQAHFNSEDASLGLGRGQRYILGEPPRVDPKVQQAEVYAAIAAGDLAALEDAVGDGDISEWF